MFVITLIFKILYSITAFLSVTKLTQKDRIELCYFNRYSLKCTQALFAYFHKVST
jgi:hypothetical protein